MAQFSFTYKPQKYTYSGVQSLSEKELRAEYSRMRDVAQKRLKRLQSSEFAAHQLARQYSEGFPKLAEIGTERELMEQFIDLSWFLRQQRSTVSGEKKIRAKALKTYREEGLEFVNEQNAELFGQFMAYVKSKYDSKLLDSERVVQWFEENRSFKNGKDKALSTISKYFNLYVKQEFEL